MADIFLTYLGHSCFRLEKDGYSVILDPYSEGSVPGWKLEGITAELIMCSHEHSDHAGRDAVTLIPTEKECPFRITEIRSWHDDAGGAKRGANIIRIFDDGTSRIAHLGDIGCELTEEQKELLRGVDVLMIPVGGFYTIDAKQAKALVDELEPVVTVPMHYRGEGFGYDAIGTLDEFTSLCDDVVLYEDHTLYLPEDGFPQTAVL